MIGKGRCCFDWFIFAHKLAYFLLLSWLNLVVLGVDCWVLDGLLESLFPWRVGVRQLWVTWRFPGGSLVVPRWFTGGSQVVPSGVKKELLKASVPGAL